MAKPKAPEGETPQQKFERVTSARLNAALRQLEMVKASAADVPSDEYIGPAIAALRKSVDDIEHAWRSRAQKAKPKLFTGFTNPNQVDLPHTAAGGKQAAGKR